jgi:hypothetical protein
VGSSSYSGARAQVASDQATIDFYYTAKNPPTYALGETPSGLEGTLIVRDVPVHDRENAYAWNTANVASGTYWIWSVINDPLSLEPDKKNFYFSPGVVTVVHQGDEIPPAVVFTPPDNPFRWPETKQLDIGYRAYDPDLSGVVRIYASRSKGGVEMTLISDDLPVGPNGHAIWEIEGLDEGEWTLKANVTDARGYSATDNIREFVEFVVPELQRRGLSKTKYAGPTLRDNMCG